MMFAASRLRANFPQPSRSGTADHRGESDSLVSSGTGVTQGLFEPGGTLLESTGLYGESSIRRVELDSGRVIKRLGLRERRLVWEASPSRAAATCNCSGARASASSATRGASSCSARSAAARRRRGLGHHVRRRRRALRLRRHEHGPRAEPRPGGGAARCASASRGGRGEPHQRAAVDRRRDLRQHLARGAHRGDRAEQRHHPPLHRPEQASRRRSGARSATAAGRRRARRWPTASRSTRGATASTSRARLAAPSRLIADEIEIESVFCVLAAPARATAPRRRRRARRRRRRVGDGGGRRRPRRRRPGRAAATRGNRAAGKSVATRGASTGCAAAWAPARPSRAAWRSSSTAPLRSPARTRPCAAASPRRA